jgi:hypothetical protein
MRKEQSRCRHMSRSPCRVTFALIARRMPPRERGAASRCAYV